MISSDLKYLFSMADNGDPWGRCMTLLFVIADYMTDRDIEVPSEWEYTQSPCGSDKDDTYYQELEVINPSEKDLMLFGKALYRLRSMLVSRGMDY